MLKINVAYFDLGETLVTGNRQWVPGAKDTLSLLRQNDIRLGIISNTANLNRDELKALLPPDFEFTEFQSELILLSSELGVEKPALPVFLSAASRAGVPPATVLFCTENGTDTLAAQTVGFVAVRLRPGSQSDIRDLPKMLSNSGLL